MDQRKLDEIAFHDKLREAHHEQRWSPDAENLVSNDPLWANFKYYAIERDSINFMRRWLAEECRDATVLDYCCGNGEESLFVAKHGARKVIGIDISEVSIRNCQMRARAEGVEGIATFRTMDAEALQFADNTFDFMMEYGVLHHLDLARAMSELARVLKPGGSMVCTETLGHNPLIRLYRRRTPHLRTAWETEHILKREHFELMRKYFGQIEMRFFHLATLGAVPFRRSAVFTVLLHSLRALDSVLLSLPWVRWQAWQVVFKISKPRKI